MKDQRRTKSIARRLPFWRVEVYLDVAAVLHEEVAEGAGFHGDLVAVGLVGLVVLVLVALLGLVLVAQGQRLVVKGLTRLEGGAQADAFGGEDVVGRLRQDALKETRQEDDDGHHVAVGQQLHHVHVRPLRRLRLVGLLQSMSVLRSHPSSIAESKRITAHFPFMSRF